MKINFKRAFPPTFSHVVWCTFIFWKSRAKLYCKAVSFDRSRPLTERILIYFCTWHVLAVMITLSSATSTLTCAENLFIFFETKWNAIKLVKDKDSSTLLFLTRFSYTRRKYWIRWIMKEIFPSLYFCLTLTFFYQLKLPYVTYLQGLGIRPRQILAAELLWKSCWKETIFAASGSTRFGIFKTK